MHDLYLMYLFGKYVDTSLALSRSLYFPGDCMSSLGLFRLLRVLYIFISYCYIA